MISGTAMAWIECLTARRSWDRDRDTARIRQAFVTLAATRRQWPAPADFVDALPPAPQLRALPKVATDPAKAAAAFREIDALIRRGGE
jgi:hypothetical protein